MSDPHAAFRKAVESGDKQAMVAALAPDVVFNSPVKHVPCEGREAVEVLFTALLETFEDFRYTDELGGENGVHALVFSARVGDKSVQGLDLIRSNDSGEITNLTVMIRPLSGLIALAEAMSAKVGHLAK
jgi:SnoaL-like domain